MFVIHIFWYFDLVEEMDITILNGKENSGNAAGSMPSGLIFFSPVGIS